MTEILSAIGFVGFMWLSVECPLAALVLAMFAAGMLIGVGLVRGGSV
jgi:hypothetical protein